jgi:hypothetical protein
MRELHVTQADIDKARAAIGGNISFRCPLAQAAKRLFHDDRAGAVWVAIMVRDTYHHFVAEEKDAARQFISSYDSGQPVFPVTFHLEDAPPTAETISEELALSHKG